MAVTSDRTLQLFHNHDQHTAKVIENIVSLTTSLVKMQKKDDQFEAKDMINVENLAIWAIGEIAIKYSEWEE